MIKAILERVDDLNDHIKSFSLRTEQPIRNVAGQFTEIYLPHTPHDTRGEKRWFTISSSPTEELMTVTTKFAPESSSFKNALHNLSLGSEILLDEPMGDFILPKDTSLPLVFVAGGIGITPFHSMIKWLIDEKQQRNITLIWSVASEEDFVFKELFSQYKMKTYYVVSKPEKTWSGLSGTLSSDRILELIGDVGKTHIYLSGPEKMVESFTDGIKDKGIPAYQVITDFFPNYTEL